MAEASESPSSPIPTISKTMSRAKTPKDFKFGHTIGEGAYSVVQHAVLREGLDTGNVKEFAIKIMDQGFIKKMGKVKAVWTEKTVLSRLSHDYIIKMHYTFKDSTSLYFVLEFIRGGELLHTIKQVCDERSKGGGKKALTMEESRYYAGCIVVALEYMHTQKIIHQDLKPENVLLTAEGTIKITDFGTALDETEKTTHNTFCGTAEYVSPEILRDEKASRGSDLWALGCIIYQLIVGRPPLKAESEYLMFQVILNFPGNNAIEWPEYFPEVAKDLILKLLVQDSKQRLGAGSDDSDLSYKALKAHPYFEGFDWDVLSNNIPPFKPIVREFDINDCRNESDEDGLLDAAEEIPVNPIGSTLSGGAETMYYDQTAQWKQFLNPGETVTLCGLVWKRGEGTQFFFSKKRQLILTNTPRLIYIDPEKMTFRGEMTWSKELRVDVKSMQAFEIHEPKHAGGRTYYITDVMGNARRWEEAISKALRETK